LGKAGLIPLMPEAKPGLGLGESRDKKPRAGPWFREEEWKRGSREKLCFGSVLFGRIMSVAPDGRRRELRHGEK
jgi:hypothetical protein